MGDARGRRRILLVIMAGQSKDDISTAATSLTTTGVKIIAVGMGAYYNRAQLSAMAFTSSYVLTTASFSSWDGISGSVSRLISQGKFIILRQPLSNGISSSLLWSAGNDRVNYIDITYSTEYNIIQCNAMQYSTM